MAKIVLALVEFILIIGAAYGFSFFLKEKHFNFSIMDNVIFRIVLGFGIISMITLLIASLHLLNIYMFVIILIIGNLLLISDTALLKKLKFERKSSIWWYFLLFFFLVNLFYSLFPPTFYDSMMYHLAVPNYYLLNDGIVSWNTNFVSNLPLNVEMLFLFSLLGKTVLIPKLISLVSGLLIILLMLFWGKDFTSKLIIYLPLFLFYTIPQVGFLSSSSKIDLIGMLFAFSAIRVFFYYIEDNKRPYLILSGVFWGLAIGSKYIFGFYMIGFFIAILFMQNSNLRKKFIIIIVISTMVMILMTPWLIKNTIITGNPLYPYLNSLFNSNSWTEAQSLSFSTGIQRGANHSFLEYLYYPLELFLKPYSYGITAVYGIFFLLLLPFIFFSQKKHYIQILKISGIAAFIIIMPFSLVPRYFLMSFLLLSIPIASGVKNVLKKFPFIKKYLIIIIVGLILQNLIMQISLQEKLIQGYSYLKIKLKSNNNKIKYLYTLPYYRSVEFLNNNLSDKEKVLFLGEDRSFYLKKKFYLSSFNDSNKLIDLIKKNKDSRLILEKMRKDNISHILFSEKGLKRMGKMSSIYQLSNLQRKNLLSFFSDLQIIFEDNLYKIYKINN